MLKAFIKSEHPPVKIFHEGFGCGLIAEALDKKNNEKHAKRLDCTKRQEAQTSASARQLYSNIEINVSQLELTQ